MQWKVPLSTETSITLTDSMGLYVAKGIDVFVSDDDCIQTASNNTVIIEGRVIAGEFDGLYFGAASPGNVDVTISKGGLVRALDGDAISVTGGAGNRITNAGSVIGYEDAMTLSAINDTNTLAITNRGRMEGGGMGIYAATSQTVALHNTGTLSGDGGIAYQAGDGGKNINRITNSGHILGQVQFWSGNDFYDGRKGHVNAAVSGADGNDRLYGGTEKNTLIGGDGKDQLWGGGGSDVLAGGTGADRFIFKALSDSTVMASGRDTVNDFVHRTDTLDLAGIDADSRVNGDQKFHFIGTQDFQHKAGELHVAFSGGNTLVQGDVNGDGKADFAIQLLGHVGLNGGDFIL